MEVKNFIDFQGGAHGNYLMFICNKFLSNVPSNVMDFLPFDEHGSSHAGRKRLDYEQYKEFKWVHSITLPFAEFTNMVDGNIIHVHIDTDDLLLLNQVSLVRAGNHNITDLETNTYNKLNIPDYKWVLDNIIESFFFNQVKESYDAVSDPLWLEVNTLEEYNSLPEHILEECKSVHDLKVFDLSEESPDCPKHILREFFKIRFKYPASHGFMQIQDQTTELEVYKNNRVFYFAYNAFYDLDLFTTEITRLAEFLDFPFSVSSEFNEIHQMFLEKQPFIDSKKRCDAIVDSILHQNETLDLNVTLLEESYINAQLELLTNKEMPTNQDQYFNTIQDIQEYLKNA